MGSSLTSYSSASSMQLIEEKILSVATNSFDFATTLDGNSVKGYIIYFKGADTTTFESGRLRINGADAKSNAVISATNGSFIGGTTTAANVDCLYIDTTGGTAEIIILQPKNSITKNYYVRTNPAANAVFYSIAGVLTTPATGTNITSIGFAVTTGQFAIGTTAQLFKVI